MKTLDRIEMDALNLASRVSSTGLEVYRQKTTYFQAAISERNKTIDEAIAICYEYLNSTYASVVVEQLETLRAR